MESAQKIHESRDWCVMHVHQFWWAWPLWFRRYRYFQKRQISMVVKKFNQMESAQKTHASRDWCIMHVHQFWWVRPLRFWRYWYFKNSQIDSVLSSSKICRDFSCMSLCHYTHSSYTVYITMILLLIVPVFMLVYTYWFFINFFHFLLYIL